MPLDLVVVQCVAQLDLEESRDSVGNVGKERVRSRSAFNVG